MSVQTEMGLDANLENVIADAWPGWVERQPVLAAVTNPRHLRAWLKAADTQLADEVLHALAWLASTEGGRDRDAALTLAWLMVPGASFLAREFRSLAHDIDHVIAAQLWILVRTFPLHRRKVSRNLMWDLRAEVLAECEAPATLQRRDPTWFATLASIDDDPLQFLPTEQLPSALEELVDMLDWACAHEVITDADRRLLLLLVEASQQCSVRHVAHHGLLGNEATAAVAALLGVCERTVRRRAKNSIRALAAAAPRYTRVA